MFALHMSEQEFFCRTLCWLYNQQIVASCSIVAMASKIFDVQKVIAPLEVASNQERVERFHNAPYGESANFLNTLMMLLGRQAIFESTNADEIVRSSTITKKYDILQSLWEDVMAELAHY